MRHPETRPAPQWVRRPVPAAYATGASPARARKVECRASWSSVADGAIVQVSVAQTSCPGRIRLRGRLLFGEVAHRENLIARAQVRGWIVVAIEAPAHVERLRLPHERHAIDPSVARD